MQGINKLVGTIATPWWEAIWKEYLTHVEAYTGLFTLVASIVGLAVLFYTAKSAIASSRSTIVAQKALEQTSQSTLIAKKALDHSAFNTRRDEFSRHFNLLLDQHNAQLAIVKSFLDSDNDSKFLKDVRNSESHFDSFNLLRGHSIISPYMRVLYHLLKHVDLNFYIDNAAIEEKKKFTSIVRSLIRNDVLFLIAVNASYVIEEGVENQYAEYQRCLHKFDFFEHAKFHDILPIKATGLNPSQSKEDVTSLCASLEKDTRTQIEKIFTSQTFDTQPKFRFAIKTPVILSAIYHSEFHSDISLFINEFESVINKVHTAEKSNFLDNVKNNLRIRIYFMDIIGRHIYLSPNQLSEKEIRNFKVSNIIDLPIVDQSYIQQYIDNFHNNKSSTSPIEFAYFCLLQHGNIYTLSYIDLDKLCSKYFVDKEHVEMLSAKDYSSVMDSCIIQWNECKNEFLQHRLI